MALRDNLLDEIWRGTCDTASFVHEEGKAGTRLCLFVEKMVELCPALLQTIYSLRELIALDKKVLGASFTI